MNFEIEYFNFDEINFTATTIIGGIFLVLIGVIYYLIFHKHHKRNNVELFELIELVTKFYARTILLIILLVLSGYFVLMAVKYQEERSDVITYLVLAIIIASLSILNYIGYIKLSLRDYDTEIRAENNKKRLKIGEVLELICFIVCILAPIWRIPGFIEAFSNKSKLAIELVKAFGISIAGLILLFALNPMDVKRFLVEEKNDNKEENKSIEDKNKELENKENKESKNEKIEKTKVENEVEKAEEKTKKAKNKTDKSENKVKDSKEKSKNLENKTNASTAKRKRGRPKKNK